MKSLVFHLIGVRDFYFFWQWMVSILTLHFSKTGQQYEWEWQWILGYWNLIVAQCSQCLQESFKGVSFWYWPVRCWNTLLKVVFCKKRRLCYNGGGWQSISQISTEAFFNKMAHYEEGGCLLTWIVGKLRMYP